MFQLLKDNSVKLLFSLTLLITQVSKNIARNARIWINVYCVAKLLVDPEIGTQKMADKSAYDGDRCKSRGKKSYERQDDKD